ncbi:MAG: hypothetical protein ACTSRZ_18255 [Promethearchaeota archaeon]
MANTIFPLFIWIIVFILGYVLIYYSADELIENLKNYSLTIKASPFIIGILILGIDPEESIASIMAVINNLPSIAVGNVVGNSIIAMTLCFALPGLFFSFKFEKIPVFYGWLILIGTISILTAFLIEYGLIITGIVNLAGFLFYTLKNFLSYKKSQELEIKIVDKEEDEDSDENETNEMVGIGKEEKIENISIKKRGYLIKSILFLILIIIGGEILIYSTEKLLEITPLGENIFGFVIIAFMTNVEEITLMIKAIKKNQVSIGMGGMVGKLIWNIGFTYGISGIIGLYIKFDPIAFYNVFFLLITSLYFFILMQKQKISRINAFFLFALFILFLIFNIYFI